MTKLIWLTDLHLVEPGRDGPQDVDPLERLRVCLKEVRTLHADCERIVISGDLIQLHNAGAYAVLRTELEQIAMPYRLLVGNHDDRDALTATFPDINRTSGFIQSIDDLDGTRILYLDTLAADGKHHGELCPTRLRWIGDQITSADERLLLIFLHHPPCDVGVPALDRLRLLDSGEVAGMVQGHRGPAHMFCGHLHRNVSGLWAGHPFASLKSLHVQFAMDMTGSKLVRSKEPPGYGVILIREKEILVHYCDIPVS